MAQLRFEHVSYTYPAARRPALQDITLQIDPGEFVLVAGASGAGKSTFLRCINGLVPHFYGGRFGGRVMVGGLDTRDHDPRQLAARVGFVFQDPEAQMVVEVVEDELVFGMENLGITPPVMRRRVEEVLDQLEIAHLRRRRLATLSGGERQRVAIAAVLAMQPEILVLDEPTSQLDPHTAEEVLTALQKLNADLGLTIVLSEHRLERVVQYADRMLLFEQSADGTPSIVAGDPRAVLAQADLAPPLVQLGRALGWQPLPLTIKAARRFVQEQGLDQPPEPGLSSEIAAPPRGLRERLRAGTQPEPALALDAVSVRRSGDEVLHRVSLAAAAGEIVALMGRNGSGKTTLLRAIVGLEPVTHGRIRHQGNEITRLPVEQRALTIGYVPQDPRTLLFHETVADELRWTLRQRALPADAVEQRVGETLSRLRIAQLADAHPREISGGEQQRVALAAILVADPSLVLLDEPTRGLDYGSKQLLTTLLRELRAAGKTIVLVTHDVELVAECADRIVLLGGGDVVVAGAPHELLNSSLIFSSQVGKLFRGRPWLTVAEALAGLAEQRPDSATPR